MSKPELVRNRKKNASNAKYFFPSKPFPHGIQLIFEDYSYRRYVVTDAVKANSQEEIGRGSVFVPLATQRAENTSTSSIELPFPRTLTDSTNIRVSQFERDFLTERAIGAASSLAAGFGDAAKRALSGARSLGTDLVKAFKSGDEGETRKAVETTFGVSGEKAFAIAAYLGRNILSGDIARSVGIVGQGVVNPQETLAFTGVDLRSFSFSWDLFPTNRSDSEQIKQIIRFLKNKSLPGTEGLTLGPGSGEGENKSVEIPGLSRAFLKYPSVVEINLLGVDETHFTRFKPCMISNIDVSYGSGGSVGILSGGLPNAVTLTISFQELSIQTSDDYISDNWILPPPEKTESGS